MNQPVGNRYFDRLIPLGPNSRSDGRSSGQKSSPSWFSVQSARSGQARPCPSSIVTLLSILGQGQPNQEPACPRPRPSICRFRLWRNRLPDELFAELRRERPIFHHELTDGVARTVKQDFSIPPSTGMPSAFAAAPTPLPLSTAVDPGRGHRRISADHRRYGPAPTAQAAAGDVPCLHPKAIGRLEEGIRRRAAAMIDRLLRRARRLDRRRRRHLR